MLRRLIALCALLSLPTVAAPQVAEPYIRALPPGTTTTAVYFVLTNDSDVDLSLVAASTPVAARAELHTHEMVDGVARMHQVPAIAIPAHASVSLEPGGLHIMVFDLSQTLKLGDAVPLTLSFSDGSTLTIQAAVRDMRPMMMEHQAMDHAH